MTEEYERTLGFTLPRLDEVVTERFSKGVHPEVVKPAAVRAAQLFHAHAGGEVLKGIIDNYPAPVPPQVIELTATEVRRLLGFDIPAAEVERVLRALQFQVEAKAGGWTVRRSLMEASVTWDQTSSGTAKVVGRLRHTMPSG